MKPIRALIVAAALAATLPGLASAQRGPDSLGADWRERQDQARGGVQSGRLVPLGRVIEMISRRVPGRVLAASTAHGCGSPSVWHRPMQRVRTPARHQCGVQCGRSYMYSCSPDIVGKVSIAQ